MHVRVCAFSEDALEPKKLAHRPCFSSDTPQKSKGARTQAVDTHTVLKIGDDALELVLGYHGLSGGQSLDVESGVPPASACMRCQCQRWRSTHFLAGLGVHTRTPTHTLRTDGQGRQADRGEEGLHTDANRCGCAPQAPGARQTRRREPSLMSTRLCWPQPAPLFVPHTSVSLTPQDHAAPTLRGERGPPQLPCGRRATVATRKHAQSKTRGARTHVQTATHPSTSTAAAAARSRPCRPAGSFSAATWACASPVASDSVATVMSGRSSKLRRMTAMIRAVRATTHRRSGRNWRLLWRGLGVSARGTPLPRPARGARR
jgi:hypothetical protein